MPAPSRRTVRRPVHRRRLDAAVVVTVGGVPRSGRDRGANPVELAILLPLIFLLLIASIQAGAYFLARAVALNAAQVAVTSARTLDGDSAATAEQKARDFVAATAGWLTPVGDADLAVVVKDEAAGEVTATVTGEALRLVPGLDLTVRQTARGPIERFVPEE
jgi:Flp pilus assembly protein TadG